MGSTYEYDVRRDVWISIIFFHEGNIEIHTVQSDSNTISLSSFRFSLREAVRIKNPWLAKMLNIMQKCRTIEPSDNRYTHLQLET